MIGIKRFIQATLKSGEFEGCRFKQLDNKLFLVFSWADKDNEGLYHLCGKIAYNCDDLQCDYDCDWYMPNDRNGEVYDTELYGVENENADDLVKCFTDFYKYAKGLMKITRNAIQSVLNTFRDTKQADEYYFSREIENALRTRLNERYFSVDLNPNDRYYSVWIYEEWIGRIYFNQDSNGKITSIKLSR